MRNDAREVPVAIEHDPIGTGAATGVDLEGVQDGELVVGPSDGREVEALIVVVLVRVGAGAGGLAGCVERVAGGDGGGDVGRPVAGAAARVDARGVLAGEERGYGCAEDEREEEGEREELWGGC